MQEILKRVIDWATDAAREQIALVQYDANNGTVEWSEGLQQSLKAEFSVEWTENTDLILNTASQVFKACVREFTGFVAPQPEFVPPQKQTIRKPLSPGEGLDAAMSGKVIDANGELPHRYRDGGWECWAEVAGEGSWLKTSVPNLSSWIGIHVVRAEAP